MTKQDLLDKITMQLQDSIDLQKKWRQESRRGYKFVAGDQYSEEDILDAEAIRKPMIVFNRLGPVIDAVVGMETGNRHEMRFVPMELGDGRVNNLLTDAVRWASQRTNEPQQTSAAFRDLVICGLGVTGTRLDYEEDPDGKIVTERLDPLLYFWDPASSGRNLTDRRWDATAKLVDEEEIEGMFGKGALEGATLDGDVWRSLLQESIDPHNADATPYSGKAGDGSSRAMIPLVEYEYYRRVPYYRIETDQGMEEVNEAEFRAVRADLVARGIKYVRQTRRRFYRVFLAGNVILEEGEAPDKTSFSRKVMTGKRDDSIRGWYGMVRAMIGMEGTQGPQQMTNKLYSESINSIAVQGKGGLLAEVDAFVNPVIAQEQWAAADSIVWVKAGGLAKIQPKPLGDYPQGMDRLLQWAVQSVPEVTGVNWELLGLVNRDQPGIVEDSRRQAAITILADYFDALKMYRAELGRLYASLVIEYMAGDDEESSTLIRLSGAGSEQVVPLLKDELTMKYDVVVDDAPSSANVKDKTWSVLVDLLPMAIKMGMPPPPNWLEYAPIPATLAQEWIQAVQSQQQQQQDPAMQALMQSETEKNQSTSQLNVAKTQESVAKAAEIQVKAQLAPQEMQLRTFEAVQGAAGAQAAQQGAQHEQAMRAREVEQADEDRELQERLAQMQQAAQQQPDRGA